MVEPDLHELRHAPVPLPALMESGRRAVARMMSTRRDAAGR
jgi:hypothetical protein